MTRQPSARGRLRAGVAIAVLAAAMVSPSVSAQEWTRYGRWVEDGASGYVLIDRLFPDRYVEPTYFRKGSIRVLRSGSYVEEPGYIFSSAFTVQATVLAFASDTDAREYLARARPSGHDANEPDLAARLAVSEVGLSFSYDCRCARLLIRSNALVVSMVGREWQSRGVPNRQILSFMERWYYAGERLANDWDLFSEARRLAVQGPTALGQDATGSAPPAPVESRPAPIDVPSPGLDPQPAADPYRPPPAESPPPIFDPPPSIESPGSPAAAAEGVAESVFSIPGLTQDELETGTTATVTSLLSLLSAWGLMRSQGVKVSDVLGRLPPAEAVEDEAAAAARLAEAKARRAAELEDFLGPPPVPPPAPEVPPRQSLEEFGEELRREADEFLIRERMARLRRERSRANPNLDMAVDFLSGVGYDASIGMATVGLESLQYAGEAVTTAGKGAWWAWNEVTHPDNWTLMYDTARMSMTWDNLDQVPGRIYGAVETTGYVAGQLYEEHGLTGVARLLLGVDNWEKVIDGKVPLTERVWRALFGAVDNATLLWGGWTKGQQIYGRGVELLRGTDAASDAARAAAAAERAAKAARAAELSAARSAAWARARAEGKRKLDAFLALLETGDDAAIRAAAADLTADKQAHWMMNNQRGRYRRAIERLNAEKKALNEALDAHVLDDLHRKNPGQRFRAVETSNPPKPGELPTTPHDRDVAYQRYAGLDSKGDEVWLEIPGKQMKSTYQEKLYELVHGERLPDNIVGNQRASILDDLQRRMDHQLVDGRSPDAYGFRPRSELGNLEDMRRPGTRVLGNDDLQVLIHEENVGSRLADGQQAGMAVSHKGYERAVVADELWEAGRLEESVTELVEGWRQMTKQFDSKMWNRLEAVRRQFLARGKDFPMPENLRKAAQLMSLPEKSGVDPETVRRVIKRLYNLTPEDVTGQIGGMVEFAEWAAKGL